MPRVTYDKAPRATWRRLLHSSLTHRRTMIQKYQLEGRSPGNSRVTERSCPSRFRCTGSITRADSCIAETSPVSLTGPIFQGITVSPERKEWT